MHSNYGVLRRYPDILQCLDTAWSIMGGWFRLISTSIKLICTVGLERIYVFLRNSVCMIEIDIPQDKSTSYRVMSVEYSDRQP